MCHDSNGTGGTHNNGTVNFANNMSNTLNYPRTGFGNNCATANGCHSSDNGEWASGSLGADACADCHVKTGTLFTALTSTAYPPNTGAHAVHNANTTFVGLNDCSECHGANADLGTHAAHKDKTLNNTVSYATADGTCTNNCHVVVDGRDWTSATALVCADCHNAGAKTLSQGAWPPVSNKHTQHVGTAANASYGDTVNHSTAGAYEFGCGSCHGTTAANHANGAKEVAVTNWTAVAKTCGQNSCHQNGQGAAPAQATVDWDAVPGYTGTDVCAICHLNSPSTAAHGVHVQGIHSKDLYTGATGLMVSGTGSTAAHGSESYSTTINCNTCHYATVTANFNDKNSYCVTCHTASAPAKGTMIVNVKSAHVNGSVDVQFRNVQVKSKAQLRDNLADAGLDTVWTRQVGYKASGADDLANAALVANDYADSTCTNACHNNNPATWTAPANDCMACHTELPK
jgi:predicted CxxxxCH...CXXCH cytochrome family protein